MASNDSTEQSINPSVNSEIGKIIEIISSLHKRVSETTTSPANSNDKGGIKEKVAVENLVASSPDEQGKSSSKGEQKSDSRLSELSIRVDPLDQLDHDLIYMQYALNKLKGFEGKFGRSIQELKDDLEIILSSRSSKKSAHEIETQRDEIRRISQKFLNLKSKIPPVHGSSSADVDEQQRRRINQSKELSNLPDKKRFTDHDFFKEIENNFKNFDKDESRHCLLCFALFPENAVIKKRLLINWWMGEDFGRERTPNVEKIPAETLAEEILQEFENKGFIFPVDKKHRKVANSFRMSPLVRSAVITLAKQKNFFDFDSEGIPTLNFKDCGRACLVYDHKEGSIPQRQEQLAVKLAANELAAKELLEANGDNNLTQAEIDQKAAQFSESMASFNFTEKPEQKAEEFAKITEDFKSKNFKSKNFKFSENLTLEGIEKRAKEFAEMPIKTLFNVSEEFPDFKYDWFSKMRNMEVLYLGRWQSTVDDIPHIEIEGTEYMKGLKFMKSLRLLSLQGISGVRELPSEVLQLTGLEILDLRACYSLDILPDDIDKLKNLTHLDISECFLLDGIPKKLSKLSNLQVLKGFVITERADDDHTRKRWCRLKDLEKLGQLRKLTININTDEFQTKDLDVVVKFKELLKLKVSWGGGSAKSKIKTDAKPKNKIILSRLISIKSMFVKKQGQNGDSKLEKLDLQCYPYENLPYWVSPDHLKQLKNLYIRGGGLNSLEENKWKTVKVLRLKYLNGLKTDWRKLRNDFPALVYLEKFKCHKVTLCPCDGTGVWEKSELKNQNSSLQEHQGS